MENASEALMMAFGVLIFVLALTVAINSFNQVKTVSDVVLYTKDETNYYDYQGATGKASENRVVGLETIIPTLYKYFNENYTVLFRKGTYSKDTGEFGDDLEPLYVYKTNSNYRGKNGNSAYLWGQAIKNPDKYPTTYDVKMHEKYDRFFSEGYNRTGNKNGNENIFSFDLDEEYLRHEPWAGLKEQAKLNLDCFLNGTIYYNPTKNSEGNNLEYINYANKSMPETGIYRGFIDFANKYKLSGIEFVETVGEYTYSSNQSIEKSAEDDNRRRIGKHNKLFGKREKEKNNYIYFNKIIIKITLID